MFTLIEVLCYLILLCALSSSSSWYQLTIRMWARDFFEMRLAVDNEEGHINDHLIEIKCS